MPTQSSAPGPESVAGAAQASDRGVRRAVLIVLACLLPLALLSHACESLAGGAVRSAGEYRAYAADTKRAATRTVGQVQPRSRPVGEVSEETGGDGSSTSCHDDLGLDGEGVTRDRPVHSSRLEFAGRSEYLRALGALRRQWQKEGLSVEDVPAPGGGAPGRGLPGVSTTQDGRVLSFGPDHYTGTPTVRVTGECVRHRLGSP